jgi:hypothetical protein
MSQYLSTNLQVTESQQRDKHIITRDHPETEYLCKVSIAKLAHLAWDAYLVALASDSFG